MLDISINHPETDLKVQEAIRSLYPETVFPSGVFPQLVYHIKTSLYSRISPEDKTHLLDVSKGCEYLIQQYCSIENLILHDPNTLILIYLPLMRSFVQRRYRYQFPENYEDITQELALILLNGRLKKIFHNYNKTKKMVGFSSYFMVSMRFITVNIIRKMKPKHQSLDELPSIQPIDSNQFDFSQEPIIQTEIRRFNTVLSLYNKKRPRLELLLKMHYRIPVSEKDVLRWADNVETDEIRLFEEHNFSKTRHQIFKQITPVFNRVEHKKRETKALIRWIQVRIKELTVLMNKFHEPIVYDLNTLETLISLYYFKYTENHKGNKNG